MKLLHGQTAIITGSTKGNGKAIAELLSAHGSNVVIVGRDEKEATDVAHAMRDKYKTHAIGVRADVASRESVVAMVKKTLKECNKQINLLVNNAGFPIVNELWDTSFHEISEDAVNKVFNVDALGTFRCCKEVLPVMMKQKSGVIVNISSTPAIAGYDKGAPYTIAKAAILGITKHIAKEYGKYGIRCNAIAPGSIATKRNWDRLSKAERLNLISGIPLGRAGQPSDVAGVSLMLASNYAGFVNGETIIVDGGEVTV